MPQSFEGPLRLNSLLDEAQKLFVNELHGPESLALATNGDIFTGTFGGNIFRIRNNGIEKIANIGGRPLGIRVDSKGRLYVVEANSGLYLIDTNSNIVNKLLGLEGPTLNGHAASKFYNDLVVDENAGTDGGPVIYFSDVSTKFPLDDILYTLGEPDSTGRILKYDVNAKKVTVLLDGIWFPNGVELSDDKKSLVFAVFTKRQILRYYLSGPKEGQTEVLVDNLPGEPDNVRRSAAKKETYWVGLAMARNASNPNIFDRNSKNPTLRKLILRTFYLLGSALTSFGKLFNYSPLIEVGHNLRTAHFLILDEFLKYPGMGIEFDINGNIVNALHTIDNKVASLSEIREIPYKQNERLLYLGSYSNPYLCRLVLKN